MTGLDGEDGVFDGVQSGGLVVEGGFQDGIDPVVVLGAEAASAAGWHAAT